MFLFYFQIFKLKSIWIGDNANTSCWQEKEQGENIKFWIWWFAKPEAPFVRVTTTTKNRKRKIILGWSKKKKYRCCAKRLSSTWKITFLNHFFSIQTLSSSWRKTSILSTVCYPPVKSWNDLRVQIITIPAAFQSSRRCVCREIRICYRRRVNKGLNSSMKGWTLIPDLWN